MEERLHKGAYPHLFLYAKENRQDPTRGGKNSLGYLRGSKASRIQNSGGNIRPQTSSQISFVWRAIESWRLMAIITMNRIKKKYDEKSFQLKELGIHVVRFTHKGVLLSDPITFLTKSLCTYIQFSHRATLSPPLQERAGVK